MVRIGRGAVLAYRKSRCIVDVVEPVVTVGAQRAKFAQTEFRIIASMRRNVIGDGLPP
jgi:hypothetical protein